MLQVKKSTIRFLRAAGLFLISFGLCRTGFGQKEAWNWYFGDHAGVEFSSGAPIAVTNGALNNYEGVASISDSSGNLLFYTDGQQVFNGTHVQMPNGFGLLGNASATQSAIILKKPGCDSLYFIFTVDYNHNGMALGDGLNYSIVNMNLQGGLGDVSFKNGPIRLPVYEKVTAVKHGNNRDYWILVNDWTSDDIYAYLLDTAGLNPVPVVSGAGPIHALDPGNTAGYMKANRQGNKLALAMWQKQSFDILDFDNLTGLASNLISVQSPDMNWTYGVEFSPDGTKLYGTKLDVPSALYQFDLSTGSPAAILNSRVMVATNPNDYYFCALQLGPDKKIYTSLRFQQYLGIIQNPDSAGLLCNYINNGLYLNGKYGLLGLPNFVPDYITAPLNIPVVSLQSSDTSFCDKHCIDFFDLSTNNPTSWQWFFPGADSATSNEQNPHGICYNSYGSFDVTLIACNPAGCDTLTLPGFINEFQNPPVPVITSSADTLFCTPAFSYQWYDASGIIPGATDSFYVYPQPGSYFVIVTDSNGCASSSSVILTGLPGYPETGPGRVYPNPTNGLFTFQPGEFGIRPVNISIEHINGSGIKDFRILPDEALNRIQLDLTGLPAGVYLLKVQYPGTVYVYKAVIY